MSSSELYEIVEQMTHDLKVKAEEAGVSQLLLWLLVRHESDFQLRKINEDDI